MLYGGSHKLSLQNIERCHHAYQRFALQHGQCFEMMLAEQFYGALNGRIGLDNVLARRHNFLCLNALQPKIVDSIVIAMQHQACHEEFEIRLVDDAQKIARPQNRDVVRRVCVEGVAHPFEVVLCLEHRHRFVHNGGNSISVGHGYIILMCKFEAERPQQPMTFVKPQVEYNQAMDAFYTFAE